jgi:hypothetical protein
MVSNSSTATLYLSDKVLLPLNKEVSIVKTMTCKQMGRPCDAPFHGKSADEVIKAEDSHLKKMVEEGDETHKSALKLMKDRWKNPIAGMGWYMKTKKAFAALPEE